MKQLVTLSVLCMLTLSIFAQAPSKFNYQAVARDANGDLLASESVSVRIAVLSGSSSGTEVYSEEHSPTTNDFGLFSVKIGEGSNQTGGLETVDWGGGSYFLSVEFDPDGGSNYSLMSATELVSVPYALYAESVANDSVDDADADPTNELQSLMLVGDSILITGGGGIEVPMPQNNDNDSTNELQTLSLSGNDLTLSNSGGTIDLSDYDQSADVAQNASDIADNASDIATNASDIADNASDIAANASDIADNATDIATNASDIADNATDIANHIADDLDTDSTNELISGIYMMGDSIVVEESGATFYTDLGNLINDEDWIRDEDSVYVVGDRVGINTSSPSAPLNVKGGDALADSPSGTVIIGDIDSGHIAIDSNDILAKSGDDAASRLWLQRRGTASIGSWYNNGFKSIISTDSSDAGNGMGGLQIYRHYTQASNSWVALYIYNNAANSPNTFGVYNRNEGSAGQDFGVYNYNNSNVSGNSYGVYNQIDNSADSAFMNYNLINSPGGRAYGSYTKFNSATHGYGTYNLFNNTSSVGFGAFNIFKNGGNHYGVYNQFLNGGYHYGAYNYMEYGSGEAAGAYSYIYDPSGNSYGTRNLQYYGSNQYGTYNEMYYADNYAYGSYNRIYYPTGYSYGSYFDIDGGTYVYGNYIDIDYPTYYAYGQNINIYASNAYYQYGINSYAYNASTGGSVGGTFQGTSNDGYGYGTRNYGYSYGQSDYAYGAYNYAYGNDYYQSIYGSYNYAYAGGAAYDYAYGVYGYASGGYYGNWGGYFVGPTYSSGGYSSSDAKLKRNIRDYEGAIADVMALKPRRYDFAIESYPTMGLPEEPQIGLVAQELEAVFPELVKSTRNPALNIPESQAKELGLSYKVIEPAQMDEEGNVTQEAQVLAGEDVEFKAVRYESLIPVLIKAVQEQQEIIESLESRIDQLENN